MTKTRLLIFLLSLLALACTLTAETVAVAGRPADVQTQTPASPPQSEPTPARVCHVRTGMNAGALNLRVCGGTVCPVVIVLHEGEILIPLSPADAWLRVETPAGARGWVRFDYVICKEQRP